MYYQYISIEIHQILPKLVLGDGTLDDFNFLLYIVLLLQFSYISHILLP